MRNVCKVMCARYFVYVCVRVIRGCVREGGGINEGV